ncbi:MAG TPA: hypothetical protein VKV80_10445 [Streptosporangiaceae bacterium]|nr:hypothetical protein [Streptosporangiaceae bacterium]
MNPVEYPAWMPAVPGLTGKTVVVVGGSGGAGEGVVRVLLSGGATVIAAGRDQRRLDDLASRTGADGIQAGRLHREPCSCQRTPVVSDSAKQPHEVPGGIRRWTGPSSGGGAGTCPETRATTGPLYSEEIVTPPPRQASHK